jgi:general secretion pathway protein G
LIKSFSVPESGFFLPQQNRHVLLIAMLITLCLLGGCHRSERKAEALFERAMQQVATNELPRAVELFQEIVDKYPDTSAARRARDAVVLYSGLEQAVETYPVRRAHDLMVQTARAVHRLRNRGRGWPRALDRLLPDLLAEPPIDPWGRPLLYQPKPRGRGYVLSCYGSDGRPGGSGDAADIFVEDGDFVRKPSTG